MRHADANILIITNIPTPYRTALFDEIAAQCSRRRVGFRVLYCAKTEPNRHWAFEPATMRHPFDVMPGLHFAVGGAFIHVNPSIITKLRVLKPTHVLCGGAWHTPASLVAATKFWRGAKRAVLGTEGHEELIIKKTGMVSWLRKSVIGLYDAYAVPNSRSAEWIKGLTNTDVRFVRLVNTVSDELFTRKHPLERRDAREVLEIPQDMKVFVQVSNLVPDKGVLELAAAFLAQPSESLEKAKLIFVGSGPLLAKLKAIEVQNPNHIRIAGQLPPEGVRRWLMAADWFVLNTHRDANPLSPIEASFAGLPVLLTSKAGNFFEILYEGKTGFGIETAAQPAAALGKALRASPRQTAVMGQAALDNARSNFHKSQVAMNFIDDMLAC